MLPTIDGSNKVPVNENQLVQLAQIGLESINKKDDEPKPELPVEDETTDDRITRLEATIEKDREERKQASEKASITRELNEAIDASDIAQKYPDTANGMRAQALALQTLSPNMNLKQAMKVVDKERQKLIDSVRAEYENRDKTNQIVKNRLGHVISSKGGGGGSVLPEGKTYTRDDVRNGTVLNLMRGYLEDRTQGG